MGKQLESADEIDFDFYEKPNSRKTKKKAKKAFKGATACPNCKSISLVRFGSYSECLVCGHYEENSP